VTLPLLGAGPAVDAITYEAESLTYFAAMSTAPSDPLKARINTLIATLKGAGLWAKLDWLSLFAQQETAQAARLNAVNPAEAMSEVNAPTFTAGAAGGYQGNGTTSYLNSGKAVNANTKFIANSGHLGAWIGTDFNGTGVDCGTNQNRVVSNNALVASFRVQSSNAVTQAVTSSIGHYIANRVDSANNGCAKDGGTLVTAAGASVALETVAINVCCINNAGTPANFSPRRIHAVHWGAGLSQGEVTAFYNALNTFMT
jgi:hypothetical protein